MPGGPRNTPITDFLFRLEVDSGFVEKFLANPRATAEEFFKTNPEVVDALLEAWESKNFAALQGLVTEEHPDEVIIIPRGWVH